MAGPLTTRRGSLFTRDPFSTLRDEIDNLFSQFWEAEPARGAVLTPNVDVCETDKEIEVRMDVPGVEPSEINIEVSGGTLTIRGERRDETEADGGPPVKHYLRAERRTGPFERSITLPCAVKEDQIQAQDRYGVLTVTLPKAEEAKTRRIEVKGA